MILSFILLMILIYFAASFMLKNSPQIISSQNQRMQEQSGLSTLEQEQKELAENFLCNEEEIKEYTSVREKGATRQQALKLINLFGKQKEDYKKKLEANFSGEKQEENT